MLKVFQNIYDATEFVKEFVGTSNYPVLSDHLVEMTVEGCRTIDSQNRIISDSSYELTVNIYKAASELFTIKAGHAAIDFDFKTDNQSFSKSQVVNHLQEMANFYKKKQAVVFPPTVSTSDVASRFKMNPMYDVPDGDCGC